MTQKREKKRRGKERKGRKEGKKEEEEEEEGGKRGESIEGSLERADCFREDCGKEKEEKTMSMIKIMW